MKNIKKYFGNEITIFTQSFSNEHQWLISLWLPSSPLQESGSGDISTLVWAGYAMAAIYLYSIVKGFFKLLPAQGLNFLFEFLYTFSLNPLLILKFIAMMRYCNTALLLVWTIFVLLWKALFSSNQFKKINSTKGW
jgi:hypothetical protein